MANLRLPTATRNALAQVLQTLVDGGATFGTIQIRSGTQPTSANDAATGLLLATLTFPDPSAPSASSGTLSFDCDPDITTTASNNGVAEWARVLDSNGVTIFDCDVNTVGSTIIIDNTTIVSGSPVTLLSFTVTMPAS